MHDHGELARHRDHRLAVRGPPGNREPPPS
jgi:hypothetical protein